MFKQTIAIAALAAGCVMASELPAEGKLDSVDRFLAEDALESLNHDAKEAEYGWEQELNGDVQNDGNDRDLTLFDTSKCVDGEWCWENFGNLALICFAGFVAVMLIVMYIYCNNKHPVAT